MDICVYGASAEGLRSEYLDAARAVTGSYSAAATAG